MRYQVIGPRHFGITNLRKVQDWIIRQRLLQVHGVVAINSWGGPTKEFRVDVKDVATVKVGYPPRLAIAGRDHADDIVFGIVVIGRIYQTIRVLPKIDAVIHKMNHDGSLPPGVKIVPFYERSDLVRLTTHTVMHNLVLGCLLIFLIQWAFLGDLRSAIIVGLTIPFALAFAIIILVARGESANLLSLGAVDCGIIVDSAAPPGGWTDRLQLILISVMQVDRAVLFSVLIIVAAFVPLFTMQGVEGTIFGPMARTYAYALGGALIGTFTVTPVLALIFLPARVEEAETLIVRGVHRAYDTALRFALAQRAALIGCGLVFLAMAVFCWTRLGSEFLPHLDAIVPVSLVLILGLLYSLFNSIKESFLALTGIPFAVAGGVMGLYLTGRDFSICAAVGFISLFGVSVMIGILPLNRVHRARRRGLPPAEAMFEAASGLMRPLS